MAKRVKRGNQTAPGKHALAITNATGSSLNKEQQLFNRLVAKIDELRKLAELVRKQLDEQLAYYGRVIYPVLAQVVNYRKELIRLCYPYLAAGKTLPKHDKKFLSEFIANQFHDIGAFEETIDEDLQEIYRSVTGMSFEEAEQKDLEEMKASLQDLVWSMGLDVDLGNPNDVITAGELEAKIREAHEKLKETANARRKTAAGPTKKQLQKEEKERLLAEARSKNIGSIYKQLAKLFHPDLEPDETLKPQKEELMKQLTTAYEQNDLHTLLQLELDWIIKEESGRSTLSGDKLKLYNQVLKEQVKTLEEQVMSIELHPRYAPLRSDNTGHGQTINWKREKAHLELILRSLQASIRELKGERAVAELKRILFAFRKY